MNSSASLPSRKKKILVMVPSASGHLNPVCSLVYELCTRYNVECIVYGIEEHRAFIEKTGAKFRLYAHRNFAEVVAPKSNDEKSKQEFQLQFFKWVHEWSYILLPQFLKDVETDKPDLIIFDLAVISVRFLLEIYKEKGTPLNAIEFFPNFVIKDKLMRENPDFFKINFTIILNMIPFFFRQISFSRTFNISVYNPISFLLKESDNPKIVAVFPELHPYANEYSDKHKFVGQCALEEARNFDLNDDLELKELLDIFPPKQENIKEINDSKFILMSLGTGFHLNWFVFETLFQAFKEYDQKPNRHFKLSQLKVLISVGEPGFKHFNEKIQKNELELSPNILLRPKVPQLEVLKRADLFITHCGMNSTSETIKYGVPIIAIPFEVDQPVVAKRTCDQLKLGIRFDPNKLNPNEIGDAIDKVLFDESYRKNMEEMSRISAKYNGAVDGAKLVIDHLNQISNKSVRIEKIQPNPNQVAPTV